MTTMPPEMSTAAATPTVALPPSMVLPRDSLAALSQSSRSRFMITDILAGSAAAAAAAMQNGGTNTSTHHHHHNNNNNNSHASNNHHANSNGRSSPVQSHAQHAALQHYLAQQQHLLQQQQQQQQQQHFPHHQSPTQQQQQHQQQNQPHHPHAHHLRSVHSPSPPFGAHHHPLSGHLPPGALMAFPPGAMPNGLHAAQAAAHYAALQQERERLRGELDVTSAKAAAAAGVLDHDDRSRSPHQVRDLSGMQSGMVGGNSGCAGGGGGGGGSSISGDQASTIDDSDSDTCGAKDDDGNSSIKSDNLMGLSKKQRKARTAFTDHQLQTLEKSFERQKYLSVQDRMELANKLELSDCQVKTWYQNRRTKWKRQTAVGLELLAEAGNYAAFQRLYGSSPYLSAWPYAAQAPHSTPSSAIDLYYRQAAAAAALQKPLSYRMYPSMPHMAGLPGMPVAPTPLSHLSGSNSLASLGGYYQPTNAHTMPPLHAHSPERGELNEKRRSSVDQQQRTPSPPLNPGSPPERAEHNSSCPPASDEEGNEREEEDEDAIEV